MRRTTHLLTSTALVVLLGACAEPGDDAASSQAALDEVTSDVLGYPLTTSVDDAREHFLVGQRELDLGRFVEANQHFQAAVQADSTFAVAHLMAANTANALEDFRSHLAAAERHAAHASEAERLMIEIARKGFDNDQEGALAAAQRLTEVQPESPRAWLALGGQLGALDRNEEARQAMSRAATLAPRSFAAQADLGNSYLFAEPRDFDKALQHMQQAQTLAPSEPLPHDFLGDVQRARNDLPAAKMEYTQGHELRPDDASYLQQRGHVNSFLGDWDAARADYDSAIARAEANAKATFGTWRAYVSIYAGDPAAAITELQGLAAAVDTMGIPEPRGVKINILTDVAAIAIHTGDLAAAEQALDARTQLMNARADQVNTETFRRGQDANIAYWSARLAIAQGNAARAEELAQQMETLMAPDANPRKDEPVHELRGFIALKQGKHADAAAHFEQGNLNDIYVKYQLGVALEGAGNAERAKAIFQDVAQNNFNSVGYALVRAEAVRKAG